MILNADRQTRRVDPEPERKFGEDEGPSKPDVKKPGAPNELFKRMKRVDPDQAKKYRQRSGQ